jgi:hypothetical protein
VLVGGARPRRAGLSQPCAVLRPVHVVVDSPVFGQDLGLQETGEALSVEVLIAHPAVEQLDPGLLPGSMKTVPVPLKRRQSLTALRDELRPVVEGDVDRCLALGGETVEATDDAVGVDGALDVTGEASQVSSSTTSEDLCASSRLWSGRSRESMADTTLGRIGQAAPAGRPMPRSGFLRFL